MNILTYFNYIANPSKVYKIIADNKNLLKMNKAKDRILANVLHEVRNPASTIINAAYLIKNSADNKLNKESVEYINIIDEYCKDILDLTNDLLDVSQLNSGKLNVDLSLRINLSNLINKILNSSKHCYLQNNVKIINDISDNLPEIYLDKKRMKQIIINLISNSVKYSKKIAKIKVSAKFNKTKNQIKMIISDNGLGMDDEDIKLAFQEYETIKNAKTGLVDSFGIGLPLVKYLTEKQNGSINIESIKGKGTKVILCFPTN